MKRLLKLSPGSEVCALALWLATFCSAKASDELLWRGQQNGVDARIEHWPLSRVLETIASSTGWEIFVEPETQHTVTTRFQNLQPADALRRLLGELNFALLPQTNGPARLFVYRTSVDGATQLVRPAKKPATEFTAGKPIPNELIVRLKPGAKESIDALAKRLGAKITGRLGGLNAYRLEFENADAAQNARAELANESDVASVENNFSVAPPGQLEPLAMSSLPPASFKLAPPGAQDKLIVALVDTPVQSGGAPWADYLLNAVSLAGDASVDPNQVTHGTAMMDTLWDTLGKTLKNPAAASIAFLPLDVYGNNSSTTMFDVANAIVQAVNKGAQIINLSLGGYGDSPFLDDVLAQARASGILLVGAAGNEHVTTSTFPAADSNVLAVTSGTRNGSVADYANYGDFVDLIAPGASIISYNGQSYLVTGTSAAAANTSGAAAALAINNNQKPLEVTSELGALPGFSTPKKP